MNNTNLMYTLSEALTAMKVAEDKLIAVRGACNQPVLKKQNRFRSKIWRRVDELHNQAVDSSMEILDILGDVHKDTAARVNDGVKTE